jgi:hypothetical protein
MALNLSAAYGGTKREQSQVGTAQKNGRGSLHVRTSENDAGHSHRDRRQQPLAIRRIPRVAFHLGRWIRTTDWYPDHQTRLYDRRAAKWTGRYVHEAVTVSGETGRLRGELQHYAYRNIADHLETIDRYTTLAARQMHEAGRRASVLDLALQPPAAFLRNYVAKGGFRDGATGFVISRMNAYYVFLKFAKLWELQQRSGGSGGPGGSGRSDR